MKVVILAGGFGTRLEELTENKPKPMIKIGNYPIIWHIMKLYSHYGFNDFIICLGYKSELIKEFFLNYSEYGNSIELNTKNKKINYLTNNKENWNIKLVETGLDSLTGTRLKKIKKFIDSDDFFLTYGDGLANLDINKLLKFHKRKKKLVTLTAVRPPERFGVLNIDKFDKVKNFSEKPINSGNYINGGFFVLSRKIFDYLPNGNFSWEREPLSLFAKKNNLYAYKHKGFWQCMDNIREWRYLNSLWEKSAPWKVWN